MSVPPDLQTAYTALAAKAAPVAKLWQYYDGDQPVVYTNERLREIFRNVNARFSENWCAVVIDAVLDRLQLEALTLGNDDLDAQLLAPWGDEGLALVADDVHEAMLVTGEAFVIAWPGKDGVLKAYYNEPALCHMQYASDDPYQRRFAAKWWIDDATGRRRLTLYYPDRLEYYVSRGKAENVSSAAAFEPDPDLGVAVNPYGEIPVFHFRRGRRVSSELENVIPVQNGINKLLIDMMVAAEFGAFRQRWIISNADTAQLKNAPNEIWSVPAGDGMGQQTSVGDFEPTPLDNYLAAIDKLATAIGVISRTPRHYFFAQGGDPSGEALIAMEAPLNKKTTNYIQRLTATWRGLARFMLRVGGTEIAPGAVTVRYAQPETVQPMTEAQILATQVGAGVPLVTALRRAGWTEAELAELAQDQQQQQAQQQATLAQAMLEAQRRFDQRGAEEDADA